MKYRLSLLVLLIAAVLVPRVAAADEVDPNVAKSRDLAATFGSQPKAELKQSLGHIRGAFSLTWSGADAGNQ